MHWAAFAYYRLLFVDLLLTRYPLTFPSVVSALHSASLELLCLHTFALKRGRVGCSPADSDHPFESSNQRGPLFCVRPGKTDSRSLSVYTHRTRTGQLTFLCSKARHFVIGAAHAPPSTLPRLLLALTLRRALRTLLSWLLLNWDTFKRIFRSLPRCFRYRILIISKHGSLCF